MRRVLIAGYGYVGAAAGDLFAQAGWEVEGWVARAASLRGGNSQAGSSRHKRLAVDISDRAAVKKAGTNFDLVIHCASSGGGGAEGYRRVYLEGARNLVEVLRPGRLIFTSSTSVYAQRDGEWVDESSPAEPAHETGRILREAEEFVRQTGGTIARLAGIYGPGRSALLRKFLAGEARIDGDGQRYLNHAHRDDIAAALFFLGTNLPNESIYNVCDNEPIAQLAADEWLAEKLQRPLPDKAGEAAPRKRGASNKRVSNRRLRALGWDPAYPDFATGMAAVIPTIAVQSEA